MPEVDSSIFHLQKLVSLSMYECKSVKSLSSNTCSPALVELIATGCINLREFSIPFASTDRLHLGISNWDVNELPSSILNKKNLKSFFFPMIECLMDLPENFAECICLASPLNHEHDPSITLHKVLSSPAFISLKHLLISDIPMLSEIPDNIFLLSSLESLTLIDIGIRSLPETIKYLPKLFELSDFNCEMLQSTPALSQFIQYFTVSNCESLETVSSSMCEPYDKPIPCTVLLNCKNVDPHSYHTVLKDAIDGIELGARLNSANVEGDTIQYLLPAMQGIEYWSHYSSTQVSFTLELPPNLLGFAYYFVLSQGHVREGVGFGCDCYLDHISGERICITRDNIFKFRWQCDERTILLNSDHVVLWYDPVSCKQIMEEIKAINDVNNTGYNPKLTFRFFIDENVYDEVVIQECGFLWIYQGQEETVSSTIFESHDEDEETVPPTRKLNQRVFGTPMPSLELDQTKGLR
ncbi:TIR-NBS-LRR resistance protein [Trifolium medium]|uniref:TIR-NBS-LRR resistance protein n=1 Tax=Trifolium medium TaxID=97028 RepID=A0A392ML32_9FABA|nr:TIR-NBS-LRR resistance protein [Trifolium medium]